MVLLVVHGAEDPRPLVVLGADGDVGPADAYGLVVDAAPQDQGVSIRRHVVQHVLDGAVGRCDGAVATAVAARGGNEDPQVSVLVIRGGSGFRGYPVGFPLLGTALPAGVFRARAVTSRISGPTGNEHKQQQRESNGNNFTDSHTHPSLNPYGTPLAGYNQSSGRRQGEEIAYWWVARRAATPF